MSISEAIVSADGKKLTRKRWSEISEERILIEPTDTGNCCIVYIGETIVSSRWNPQREDLIADDWIISE